MFAVHLHPASGYHGSWRSLPRYGRSLAVQALTILLSVQANAAPYHPNRVVVQFSPGVVTLPSGQTDASIAATTFVPEGVGSTLQSIGATWIKMLTPTATPENLIAVDPQGRTIQLDLRQLDFYVVDLADTNVMEATSTLAADEANVVGVHPDWLWHMMLSPNDGPLYAKQWWLHNTGQYLGVPGEDLR